MILLSSAISYSCGEKSAPVAKSTGIVHPEWSRNLTIYEVNIRQFSEAGTFAEFEKHLPRLQKMGVGILWLMPIHPIGELNRKGTMGSYYAVKDYRAINPEFGTLDEFKSLVKKIHDLGMYVIIDWVANHSAWDNALTVEHPEWYTKDSTGNFTPPVADWADVIDLNYDNPDLRKYMIDALAYWVRETDIDGYRCDVAGMVPTDFWNDVRAELDKIKPVFMLAEWEDPALHKNAFDMTYGWDLYHAMNDIAAGKKSVAAVDTLLTKEMRLYPNDAFRMRFTSNHDENSWNGTVFERLGDGAAAFAVAAGTLPGMLLMYGGQEAGLDKRLQFFEKDPIEWREHEFAQMYSSLLNLKRENQSLWNGAAGAEFVRVPNSSNKAVLSFVREKAEEKIFVVINFSGDEQNITFSGTDFWGEYTELFTQTATAFSEDASLQLPPWGYRVFVN
jgi:glycosidase